MQIEHTEIYGFDAAIRSMRNPLNSWDKSDSKIARDGSMYEYVSAEEYNEWCWTKNYNGEKFILGEADRKLSQNLVKAGDSHSKHLRLIQVWVDLTLPRFIWQEFDTYRYIEKVSCSTMHTLMKKNISEDMFEDGFDYIPEDLIGTIQGFIDTYKSTTNPEERIKCKYNAKRLLPESFLQKRTINTNYQCLLNIYKQRKNHELPQWKEICGWILSRPYFKELTGIGEVE